ncbi:MAG: hypothetical protein J6V61_03275 [Bacteroidaceae bacterium]|nr:hypothetical protein [Bacteroidaceae bacterium]
MKHKGSICDFLEERNSDLFDAYRTLLESVQFIDRTEISTRLVNMPSRRFWVSEERAAIVISAMMHKRDVPHLTPTKKEMFDEIYKRALVVMKENPHLSIYEVARIVVNQPAPKFYITPGSAKVIIYYKKKAWYEKRKKQLRHLF